MNTGLAGIDSKADFGLRSTWGLSWLGFENFEFIMSTCSIPLNSTTSYTQEKIKAIFNYLSLRLNPLANVL